MPTTVLTEAANRLEANNNTGSPGQYRHVRLHAWWMCSWSDGLSFLAEHVVEEWAPPSWEGEWLLRRMTTGARREVSGDHTAAEAPWPVGEWRAPGRGYRDVPPGWGQPVPEFVDELPRDPEQLLVRLRQGPASWEPEAYALKNAIDAFSSGLWPADRQAPLYRALSLLPGLRVTEAGDHVVAIGVRSDKPGELLLDPSTGSFVGTRVNVGRDEPLYSSSTTSVSWVDHPG